MLNTDLLTESTVSSKEVFEGKLLHVFYDEAKLPDGEISTREWIKHPGASAIVPIFENGDVMLVNQFRYSAQQIFLEVPAGKIDSGENPHQTAVRELKEETGLSTEELHYVGHFFPAIGYSNEVIHIYIAKNLSQHEDATDEDEFVQKERIQLESAIEMVYSGEINDGKTICCLLRAQKYLQSNNKG